MELAVLGYSAKSCVKYANSFVSLLSGLTKMIDFKDLILI